ncbi:sulfatase-like hydrolase/transferase [Bacteroides coprosuis]|uniref:sulfatase-like hydrolase/transferase n=1 Tax=Bacteroides coprosuis TaxID=151276 RepID=UPI001DFFB0E8|nr:sulfatase-like hydrolase/transferase [Bacteroides coprosuis]HJD91254.1 sulfatase-like hydrolase/transferase [Bacteroides coprosuis]
MNSRLLLSTLTMSCVTSGLIAQNKNQPDKPNILCLAFEDTSAFLFGCYGNDQVHTPHIDKLAREGVQFMNAWSTAPQSSPARSSLITGSYATTYGMDVHPVAHITPKNILFPELLKNAGYYCTNNSKTHYNTKLNNKSCWNDCRREATYNHSDRDALQPFFSVFNSEASHMGRMRTFHMEGRRDYLQEGINIDSLVLPLHFPDLPEMYSDYAAHLEAAQDIDKWVGTFLADLEERGLSENTIIFVYSDHGGCLPRGKGYLYETGLKIPFVVYFPPKWKHLAKTNIPSQQKDLVGFVDFAPTILSLAGVSIPESMQGKAFMGEEKQPAQEYQYAFATNQLHHYMPVRAVTDGKYKYIRNYIPYRRTSLRNYYQWGMPANIAWDTYVFSGKNENPIWNLPYEIQPSELLFDLESDPWEMNNLAATQEYRNVLERFREKASTHIRKTHDLGFFLPSSREGVNIYSYVREGHYPLEDLYNLVELASSAQEKDIDDLLAHLKNPLKEFRYWAVVGLGNLAQAGYLQNTPQELLEILSEEDPYLSAEAAYALYYSGAQEKALEYLVDFDNAESSKMKFSILECLSKDKSTHSDLSQFKDRLLYAEENMPAQANEDPGLMAKGILADMGIIEVKDIYSSFYEQGVKLNKGRRISRSKP